MMRDKMRTKNVERRVIKCERVENDYDKATLLNKYSHIL